MEYGHDLDSNLYKKEAITIMLYTRLLNMSTEQLLCVVIMCDSI